MPAMKVQNQVKNRHLRVHLLQKVRHRLRHQVLLTCRTRHFFHLRYSRKYKPVIFLINNRWKVS